MLANSIAALIFFSTDIYCKVFSCQTSTTFGQLALRYDDISRFEKLLLEGIDKASHDVVVYSLQVRDLLLPFDNVGGKSGSPGDFIEDVAP